MTLVDIGRGVRRTAGLIVKSGGRLFQRFDPASARAARAFRRQQPRRTLLLCVYRANNARFVMPIVTQAVKLGAEVHLWALDRVASGLAGWTRGSGAGSRMTLLNRLWALSDPGSWERVVISDDDFIFSRGDLRRLLDGCELCGFDIAQPAHACGSYAGRQFPRCRAFTVARLTSWVDVGPMFVASGNWLPRVLPFPDDAGMGWGLGLTWGQLRQNGCRLGIVDAICVRHLFKPRLEYDANPESRRVAGMLKRLNLQDTKDAQQCLERWMFWQSRPPWRAPA